MPIQGTPQYLPAVTSISDVRQGVANYYHVRLPNGQTEEDSVWWYRNPNPECIEIKGLLSFYDEKFDVYVDGVLQQR